MDIAKDLLGIEPNPDYIKTLLNNMFIMRDSFPLTTKEQVIDILGGSGSMVLIYDDVVSVDELAEKIMSSARKINEPDQLINYVVEGNYVNIYTLFLVWSEIIKFNYPLSTKAAVATATKRLKGLGIDIEWLVKKAPLPIEDSDQLFLYVIYSNPEIVDADKYSLAAEEVKKYLSEGGEEAVSAAPQIEESVDAGEAVQEMEGDVVEMESVSDNEQIVEEEPTATSTPSPAPEQSASALDVLIPHIANRRLSQFVPPAENRFILTALRAVARMPSGAYNPVFIYGPAGSGKSHLLYALKNEIAELHPDLDVAVVKGSVLLNIDLISLSRAAVVLIDDLDSALNSDANVTIQIISALVDDNKQVVSTLKQDPHDIPAMQPLLEKYEGNLIEGVAPLKPEDILSVLDAWVQWFNSKIGDAGIDMEIVPDEGVLEEIWNRTGDMEGALELLFKCFKYLVESGSGDLSAAVVDSAAGVSIGREEAMEEALVAEEVPAEEFKEATVEEEEEIVEFQPVEEEDIEEGLAEGEGIELIPGLSYFYETESLAGIYQLFWKLSTSGYPAVTISRTNPKILLHKYNIAPESIFWLTEKQSSEYRTVPPVLENILYVMDEYMDGHDDADLGMIILDGLEYLISTNNFNTILKFIRHMVDSVAESNFILVMPVSPLTVSEQELRILEKETEKLPPISGFAIKEGKVFVYQAEG